jgi:hypothetical protein
MALFFANSEGNERCSYGNSPTVDTQQVMSSLRVEGQKRRHEHQPWL